jgi:uncharacterized phage protein gp47/JayE
MSLAVPTTQELSDNIVAQLEASLSQTIPLLPKAFTRVLAKALAGALALLYRYAGFIFLQLFVAHASFRETTILGVTLRPLVEWGRLIGLGDPNDAVRAELVIDVTVTTQDGSLAAGTQLVRPDTQVIYLVKNDVLLDAPTIQATIVASADPDDNGGAGDIGNLGAGDTVEFANPLPNVERVATVSSQAVTGADGETPEEYRARVIARFQARPQGGAYADYRDWALDVEGIIRVYPYTSDTPGEVDVYCEATEASSGSEDGIPTGAQLTAVEEAIELDDSGLASRRPAGAAINVAAITRTALGVEVVGLEVDDEATVQAAIEEGLDEFMRSREPFIVGLSVFPRQDRITVAAVGGVVDGIVSAYGGSVTSVILLESSFEIPLYQLGPGEKAKLETPVVYS